MDRRLFVGSCHTLRSEISAWRKDFLPVEPQSGLSFLLGLIVGNQTKASALLQHFGSLPLLAQASLEQLLPFVSRAQAFRVISACRLAAVALRQERQQLTIKEPQAVADLCSEMRFRSPVQHGFFYRPGQPVAQNAQSGHDLRSDRHGPNPDHRR